MPASPAPERNPILMKKALIIGGGPAGLTAAYELLKGSQAAKHQTDAPREEYEVLVFEESDLLGGISKTVEYKGNRMDMGGHRFFSKDPKVNEWWKDSCIPGICANMRMRCPLEQPMTAI